MKYQKILLYLFAFAMPLILQSQVEKKPAPAFRFKGTIIDSATRKVLDGTFLILEGKNSYGTSTDHHGRFNLKIQHLPTTVKISRIGYQSRIIRISSSNLDSTTQYLLTPQINNLSDIVVVGYGRQTKSEITGSITHLSGNEVKDAPVQSFDQALSGKASGVSISLPNGVLNNPPVIRIRGINSISLSSYPLIVVDGIPINTGNVTTNSNVINNPLGDINPEDIQSIDILKDAASTAIYGSRAAAGVLIITTKKGKKGRQTAAFNAWTGITNAVRLPKMLNATEYMEIKNEAVKNLKDLSGNANNSSVDSAAFFPSYHNDGSLVNTKWYDYIYHTGSSANYTFNVSGGNDKTTYYLSANYSDQNGFLIGNTFKRKAIRFNLEHNLTSWAKITGGASYSNDANKSYNTGSLTNDAQLLIGSARLALALPPNVAAYNEDGSFNLSSTGAIGMGNNTATSTLYNPAALFKYSRYSSVDDHFLGNVGASFHFLRYFDFNTTYSLDRSKIEDQSYLSPDLGSSGYAVGGSATNVSTLIENWDWFNTLSFQIQSGRHHVSLLAGTDEQQTDKDIWGAAATVSSDDYFQYYQGGWTNVTSSGNSMTSIAFISGFGRLNYDYDGKYFLSINYRRDGNSALASGHKYGSFGGLSIGWTVSQETFYQQLSLSRILSSLKIKGSYGKVGNGNLTSNYASQSLYSSSLYGSSSTWYLSQIGNSNLRWETSKQTNIGIDFELWQGRAHGEIAYFNNNVDGLILSVPQSPSKGIPGNTILQNIGSMYNRGAEISFGATIIESGKFRWNASANFTYIKNKVTALATGGADIIGYTHTSANANNVTRVGYSISSLYGAKTLGVNPENGRRIFVNAAGEKIQYSAAVGSGESNWTYLDGTTAATLSASDYYLLANALPKWYGGFVQNFNYGNLDLSLNFTYSGGNYEMNGTKATLRDQTAYNNYHDIYKRWTTVGQKTDIPRLVYNDVISNGTSFPISSNVEKADFLRLQQILLGYRIDNPLLRKQGISSVRVYVQATNVFLITGYSGLDPETSVNGNSNTNIGVERNSVGQGRTITIGVNIGF